MTGHHQPTPPRPAWPPHPARRPTRPAAALLALLALVAAAPLPAAPLALRVVAANLTAGDRQSYSPDNANHSNPEGAGARILMGLRPDVVLIQEFTTSIPVRQWVNRTFGRTFSFHQEPRRQIPNGVVSRFPITAAGAWDDPTQDNREFAWARIALPGDRTLWAVSVHFSATKAALRPRQARALVAAATRQPIPAGDLVVLGGDLNLRTPDEPALRELARLWVVPRDLPCDQAGNPNTNAPRKRPYDWILANPALHALATPVSLGGDRFPAGLVFDSRAFEPLAAVPPVQPTDSAVPGMQHMAVVRDFTLP